MGNAQVEAGRACSAAAQPQKVTSLRETGRKSNVSVSAVDPKKLDTFFKKYRCPDGTISSRGIEQLCADLGISALDPVTLVIAYHCAAVTMGVFTQEEFNRGMTVLGCDSVSRLRVRLDDLRAVLADKTQCKEVYEYTFQFALDPGQRCLPPEICIELWRLFLPPHFRLLDAFIDFMERRVKHAISKDTWMMVYDLATQVQPDLSDYDIESSWPVVLDEFVESVRGSR